MMSATDSVELKPRFMVNVALSVNYPVRFFLPPSIKVQVRLTILW